MFRASHVTSLVGFAPTFYFGLKTMDGASIEERIREIAAAAARHEKVEFVHCEIVGARRNMTVRVYVDKEGGITLDDCAAVSRRMEETLDADDLIPTAYLLEVSSPGLERELYSIDDFRKFVGEKVKVKLRTPLDGQKVLIGPIAAVEGNDVILKGKTGSELRFPYSDVAKANLRVDLEQEFKKR